MKNIIRHKNCGGIISFDSFGNWKCKKCKKIGKEQKCPKRNVENGREETLAYATLEELLDLKDEINEAIKKITDLTN